MKRTCVVTGAATGIGTSTADRLADGGAEAILRDESTERGEVRHGAVRRTRLLVKYLVARLHQRRVFTKTPEKEARR